MGFYVHFYGECEKNFAAATGGLVFDGCQQFEPSEEPNYFLCEACGCHRDCHRICEISSSSDSGGLDAGVGPARLVSSNTVNANPLANSNQEPRAPRIIFSDQQALQMRQLATRLEWSMPRTEQQEQELWLFCLQACVSRRSFELWMSDQRNRHNG